MHSNIIAQFLYIIILGIGIWPTQLCEQVPVPESKLRLSYITYGTNPNAEKWFEYNDNGDLIRQAISKDTIVYEYTNQKIIKRHIDKKLNWLSTVTYTLDENGKVISSLLFDEDDKEISDYKFEYNADGYISRTIQKVRNSATTYTQEFVYKDDNLKEIQSFDQNGKYSSKYVFEYFSDLPNVFNLDVHQILDDILPNERLGKMNKNMIRQMVNISKEGDTLSLLNYKYTPLSKGKLKEYQSDVLNEFDTEVTYHFNKN